MECPPSTPISDAILPARDPLDVVRRAGHFEHVRIPRDHRLDDCDLLERGLQRLAFNPGAGWHIDRPELRLDTALAQPRDIGVQGWAGCRDVQLLERRRTVLAQRPGQIVVPIDEHGRVVNLLGPFGDDDWRALRQCIIRRRLCDRRRARRDAQHQARPLNPTSDTAVHRYSCHKSPGITRRSDSPHAQNITSTSGPQHSARIRGIGPFGIARRWGYTCLTAGGDQVARTLARPPENHHELPPGYRSLAANSAHRQQPRSCRRTVQHQSPRQTADRDGGAHLAER